MSSGNANKTQSKKQTNKQQINHTHTHTLTHTHTTKEEKTIMKVVAKSIKGVQLPSGTSVSGIRHLEIGCSVISFQPKVKDLGGVLDSSLFDMCDHISSVCRSACLQNSLGWVNFCPPFPYRRGSCSTYSLRHSL